MAVVRTSLGNVEQTDPQPKPLCQHWSGLVEGYFRSLCPITSILYPHTFARPRFQLLCIQENGLYVFPYDVWLLPLTFS